MSISTLPSLIIGVIIAGIPLVGIEAIARRFEVAPELSRKLVHVGSCLAVVALTLFLSLVQIAIIALGFLVFMLALRRRHIWKSLYRVERQSWGEICFPLSVGIVALFAPSVAVFITAMLVMGLADTAAAVVGGAMGHHKLPWSPQKSLEGTAACFVVALIICFAMSCFGAGNVWLAVSAALLAATAESFTPNGFDNLTVPLAVLLVMA